MEFVARMIKHKCLDVFYKLPKNILHNKTSLCTLGDSLEVLKNIKDNSIDLVFADPPYNIGKTFGKTKESLAKDDYIEWCKNWIDESIRILAPSGVLCFMTATQHMPYLDCYVDMKYDVISRVIWYYDSSGVQAKRNFGSMYEPITIVAKDKSLYNFYPDNVKVEAKTGAVRKLIDYRKTPPQPYNTTKVVGNVWNIPRVRYKMTEYESHPSQKPERLLERIILAFTDKNNTVLDPFAGTFTTSAVSQRFGRYSIGIEKEEQYYKIGLRRLGISDKYNGERLIKLKERLTNNKSKKDHITISHQTQV